VSSELREHLARAVTIPDKNRRQLYLAAIVAETLRRAGIHAVLVGGATVELYMFGEYATADVYLVCGARGEELAAALRPLGFEQESDLRHWSHPDLPIPVEFPPTPAQVGPLPLRAVRVVIEGLAIDVASVEDTILDRVIAAQKWRSRTTRRLIGASCTGALPRPASSRRCSGSRSVPSAGCATLPRELRRRGRPLRPDLQRARWAAGQSKHQDDSQPEARGASSRPVSPAGRRSIDGSVRGRAS
jgi:hypothetical protein